MYFRGEILQATILFSHIVVILSDSIVSKQDASISVTCTLPPLLSSKPFITYPIHDQVGGNNLVWSGLISGSVRNIFLDPSPHLPYLKGTFCPTSRVYRLTSTHQTTYFTQDMAERMIHRNITLECADGTSIKYQFQVPLWDMSTPQFLTSTWQVFNITTSLPRDKPIPCWYCVLVAANVTQVGNPNLQLKECPSEVATPYTLIYDFEDVYNGLYPHRNSYNIIFTLDESIKLESGMIISKCYRLVDPTGLESVDELHIDVYVE